MPAFYAHKLFGERVFACLPQALQTDLALHKAAFILGTQGPDILFYHKPFAKNETKEKGAEEQDKSSNESEKTYIIVRDKNGAETPLLITSYMPRVRGVSVICNANETDAEKIKNAVSAALDITLRKIYIGRKISQ